MGIAVKFLNAELSARFIMRYLETTKNMGLPTQYFVAHDVFKSLTAIVTHGISGVPDIMLGDDAFVDLLLDNQRVSQGIEVKFITWAYTNFAKAVQSAISRKQTKFLLIILSPTLRITHLRNTMFNKLNEGLLSVVVIIMDTVEAKTQKLWKEVQTKIDEQLGEDEEIVAFPGDLYNAYMFQVTKDLDIQNSRIQQDIQKAQQDVEKVQNNVEKVQNNVEKVQNNVEKVQQDMQLIRQEQKEIRQEMQNQSKKLDKLLKILTNNQTK